MTDPTNNRRPLTITLDASAGELVRDFAQAQRVTYTSAVRACVQLALAAGLPTVMEPFGEPEENVRKGEQKA